MKAVIDASFVLDFLFPDEGSPEVLETFKNEANLFVSSILLQFEVANILKSATKSNRIKKEDAEKILKIFLSLQIEFLEVDIKDVLGVSLDKDLSIYDATYVALANQQKLPLLTLDKKLKEKIS